MLKDKHAGAGLHKFGQHSGYNPLRYTAITITATTNQGAHLKFRMTRLLFELSLRACVVFTFNFRERCREVGLVQRAI